MTEINRANTREVFFLFKKLYPMLDGLVGNP